MRSSCIAFTLLIAACGSSSDGTGDGTDDAGTGGAAGLAQGSGGTTAAGGSIGAGGSTKPGGTGGSIGTGGSTKPGGTGGSSAAGGSTGSGGSSATGGSTGTGGAPPTVGECAAPGPAGQWQDITPAGAGPMALVVDPFVLGTIWLGTGNGTASPGLFRSDDCGASFKHVNTGTNGSEIDKADMWSLAIDWVDQGTVYVIGMYGPQGVWKSTNGGVDWTQTMPPGGNVAVAMPAGPSNPPMAGVGSLTIDPTNHLHLVAGAHANCTAPYSGSCGAESKDGGKTWRLFNAPGSGWAEQAGPYLLNDTSWLFATLFSGLWLTTDSGNTWSNVTPSGVGGATGGEYTDQPISRGSNGTYYLPSISQGGLLKSADGKSWSRVTGAPTGSYELGLATGGGKIFLGDANDSKNLAWASESDLSKWTPIAPPSTNGGSLPGSVFLAYDTAHHFLYSVNWTNPGKAWRMYAP